MVIFLIYTHMHCSFTKLANNTSPLLISFCWIFQAHPLIKTLSYPGRKSWTKFFENCKIRPTEIKPTRASCSFDLKKKNVYFSSFLCILQDKKRWGNESTFSVINHYEMLAFQIQLSLVHTKMALEISISYQIDDLKKNLWTSLQNVIVFSSFLNLSSEKSCLLSALNLHFSKCSFCNE